MLICLEVSVAG